jgi:hypothetical protein
VQRANDEVHRGVLKHILTPLRQVCEKTNIELAQSYYQCNSGANCYQLVPEF